MYWSLLKYTSAFFVRARCNKPLQRTVTKPLQNIVKTVVQLQRWPVSGPPTDPKGNGEDKEGNMPYIQKVWPENHHRRKQKSRQLLDVTLDLNTEKFQPYSKTANTPLYVHSKSNHPRNIIRNIPESVNRRLSEISSDEAVFNEAATPYQDALYKSGYRNRKIGTETMRDTIKTGKSEWKTL